MSTPFPHPSRPELAGLGRKEFLTYGNLLSASGGRILTRLGQAAHQQLVDQVYEFCVNEDFPKLHTRILEKTPERIQVETDARQFVAEVTGVVPQTEVFWQSESAAGGNWGAHFGPYDLTYVSGRSAVPHELKSANEATVLVHELAHATGSSPRVIVLSGEEVGSADNYFRLTTNTGMRLPKLVKNEANQHYTYSCGDFFEEGFAEETAARWREAHSSDDTRTLGVAWMNPLAQMPDRFVDAVFVEEESSVRYLHAYSAYPAHTLTLLSRHTGVDLYDLMCEIRRADDEGKRAALKRNFIATINSVHPGLYKELRDTPYDEESFKAGLQRISNLTDRYY